MAEEADQVSTESSGSKGGKSKMLKMILIPVVIVAQAAAAYFLVFNVLADSPDKSHKPVTKKKREKTGQFYEIKDLVVNPAGSMGRFLVLELAVEATDTEIIEEAQAKEIWMRDAVISLLTKKRADELLDVSKRDSLKTEILGALNSNLSKEKFDRIFFTKFIMQ